MGFAGSVGKLHQILVQAHVEDVIGCGEGYGALRGTAVFCKTATSRIGRDSVVKFGHTHVRIECFRGHPVGPSRVGAVVRFFRSSLGYWSMLVIN